VRIEDGSVITSDIIVIATDASKILGIEKPIAWKACDTLYFEVEQNTLKNQLSVY
jgi:hypothetical protein